MFKKILFPTDFSDVATRALEYVKQLKDSGAEEVVVLHVIDERGFASVNRLLGETEYRRLKKSKKEEAERRLQRIADDLTAIGLNVQVRMETGMPFQELLKAEKEENVSVIVLGSHGVSNLQEMLLGSVVEKVVRKSIHPVLVIKR